MDTPTKNCENVKNCEYMKQRVANVEAGQKIREYAHVELPKNPRVYEAQVHECRNRSEKLRIHGVCEEWNRKCRGPTPTCYKLC